MKTFPHSALPLGELACAASLFVAGAFFVLYGLRYPAIQNGVVGPGLMPLISGSALAASAAVVLFKLVAGLRTEPAQTQADRADTALKLADFSEDEPGAAGKPATVVGILLMLVLSVVLTPYLGLIPMLGALVFVCVFVFEREGAMPAAAMALGSMALSWLVFVWLFEVPMPNGSIWQALGG